MALETIQQIEKLFLEAKKVLVLLPQNPDGDLIGASWGLHFFLKNKNIESVIAYVDATNVAQRFSFLPVPEKVQDNIAGARDFILIFNTKYNKITNVRSEKENDELKIYITPEHGSIDPRDFSFVPAKFKYDLVVVLGSPDKESMGKIYESDPDIFYEVPVVNIDNHANNENYGQVNIVSLTASSVSELLADILTELNNFSIDPVVAQCFLAGIMSSTDSFQRKNTTPKALKTAANLMDLGANQQEIVRFLYKTQPFNILKLWGRIMARLKWDDDAKLAWAPVYLEDFVQSRTSPGDLVRILEKLADNFSAGKNFLLFYNQNENTIVGLIKSASSEKLTELARKLDGVIERDLIRFNISGKNVADVERELVEKIKSV